MLISVVICTYNRAGFLPFLFESIVNQSLEKDRFEVVMVNNNSTDNTEEICKEFEKNNPDISCKYVIELNQGLSFARNRGYKESRYDYIAYLDDDAYIDKDYLHRCSELSQNNPEVSAFGGKILLDYMETVPVWSNKYVNSLLGYYERGDKEFTYKWPEYPRGSNMVFKKNILELVGGFNTGLGRIGKQMLGGEEKDIFKKIYNQGALVKYDPKLIVYHFVPASRIQLDFIKKQSIYVGYSDKIRTMNEGLYSYIMRLLIEIYKWGGTIVLAFLYLIKGNYHKSKILLQFRYWISTGLLGLK